MTRIDTREANNNAFGVDECSDCSVNSARGGVDPCSFPRPFRSLSLLMMAEASSGNNVSVPYLFMCDRTLRCRSAEGSAETAPGRKKDTVIDFPAE